MNMKKQVLDSIKARLESEQRKIRMDIERGKRDIAELTEMQTVRKRELAEISSIINSLGVDKAV